MVFLSLINVDVSFQVRVKVVSTEHALHFFDHKEIPSEAPLYRDCDEWQVGGFLTGRQC